MQTRRREIKSEANARRPNNFVDLFFEDESEKSMLQQ